MKILSALAAAALAGCAPAPSAEAPPAGISAGCALTIAFGSYAMGIDRETFRRVEALLEGDPAVTGVTRSSWGREGEVTLCAAVRRAADRDRLFAAIAALFPRRPHGPLSVTTNDGREFQANNDS